MKNKNYIVSRKNVFFGQLILADSVGIDSNGNLLIESFKPLRAMLFTISANRADDLLFDSPRYSVEGFTSNLLTVGENVRLIIRPYNMDEILKIFQFPEELNYNNILQIKKLFFNGNFAVKNPEIFGYFSLPPDISDELSIFGTSSAAERYSFIKTNEGLLPSADFEIFDSSILRILDEPFKPSNLENQVNVRKKGGKKR